MLPILNIQKLILRLKENSITKFQFWTANIFVVGGFLLLPVTYQPQNYTTSAVMFSFLGISVVGTLLSLLLSYTVNKKGDGKSFWTRYVIITLYVTMKTFIFFVVPLSLAWLLISHDDFMPAKISVDDLIIYFFTSLLIIYFTTKNIRRVSS